MTGVEIKAFPAEDVRVMGKGPNAKAAVLLTLPVDGEKMAKEEGPVTVSLEVSAQRPPRIFFVLYYLNPAKDKNRAFVRAAETWEEETKKSAAYRSDRDLMLELPFVTESDFKTQWAMLAAQNALFEIRQGVVFSHASIDRSGGGADGLTFAVETTGNDATLHNDEVQKLAPLTWDPRGDLTLTGCNTGVTIGKIELGIAPHAVSRVPAARAFADTQHVRVVGQSGYGYFSKRKDTYVEIDDTGKPVYLWAFSRRKNNLFGGGGKMDGVTFSPPGGK